MKPRQCYLLSFASMKLVPQVSRSNGLLWRNSQLQLTQGEHFFIFLIPSVTLINLFSLSRRNFDHSTLDEAIQNSRWQAIQSRASSYMKLVKKGFSIALSENA